MDLERAIDVMTPSIRRYNAQLVVAQTEDGTTSATILRDHPKASIVRAPKGASRAQLCDVGMAAATGDIVALRDDSAVRDAGWLDSFSHSLMRVEVPQEIAVRDYSDFSAYSRQENGEDQAAIESVRRHSSIAAALAGDAVPSSFNRSIPSNERRVESAKAGGA